MNSLNLKDAKKECLHNPSCPMFFDNLGTGYGYGNFYGCENTASIRDTWSGSAILYTKDGNYTYVQF